MLLVVKQMTLYNCNSGKGLGSFIGGQLSQLPQGLTGVFASTSIFTGVAGLLIFLVYSIWGRKWERQVIAEKKIILDEMEKRREGDNGDKQRRSDSVTSGVEALSTNL